MSSPKPFWMVYGEGQRAPTYKHSSPYSAKAEAKRLAADHPSIEFYVLASIGVAKRIEVDFTEIDPTDDGIPF